uniref:DUF1899 domain-containing protein n=1 Tax=Macrostomum lignano TaxID=282301 RepID=A0A1I8HEU4_9PLAT
MWSQKLITAVSEVKPSFLDINDRFVSALDRHGQVHVFDAASCERLHTCDTGSPEPATAVAVRPPHLLIGIEAKVELRTLQDDLPDGPLTRAWSIAWSDAPLREASLRQAAPYFALRSPGLCPVNQLCWWWRSPQAGA